MSLELFVEAKDSRLQRLQVAAAYAGVTLSVKQISATAAEPALLADAPPYRLPILKTAAGGSLSGTSAILRHLAGLRCDVAAAGFSAFDESAVDQWLEWTSAELEPVTTLLAGQTSALLQASLKASTDGAADKAEVEKAASAVAAKNLPALVSRLEGALASKTFLVGERISLADLSTASVLISALSSGSSASAVSAAVSSEAAPAVARWLHTCRHQPCFVAVFGEPAAAAASAAAPAAAAAGAGAAASSGHKTGAAAVATVAADGSVSSLVPSALTAFDTQLPAPSYRRFRQRVADLLLGGEALVGSSITVCGWARTVREAGAGSIFFLAMNDGSCFDSLQCVAEKGKTEGFEAIAKAGGTHASFRVTGLVVKSPAKGQSIELQATAVSVLGGIADPSSYPLSKKKHSPEFLRDLLHLRPRTNLIGAVARIRNACSFAVHKFFQERGFLYVHTPILTSADCEGAGEMFAVTTLMPSDPTGDLPRVKPAKPSSRDKKKAEKEKKAAKAAAAGEGEKKEAEGGAAAGAGAEATAPGAEAPAATPSANAGATAAAAATEATPAAPAAPAPMPIDYSKDFFGKPVSLTVSGQLQVECFASALSDVYTFGPTFRAENSHTSRHLAEFWMIEPEMAFAGLEDDMAIAEDFLKYCTRFALEHCQRDLAFFEEQIEPGLRARLENVASQPFKRLTYTEAIELLTKPEHVSSCHLTSCLLFASLFFFYLLSVSLLPSLLSSPYYYCRAAGEG